MQIVSDRATTDWEPEMLVEEHLIHNFSVNLLLMYSLANRLANAEFLVFSSLSLVQK